MKLTKPKNASILIIGSGACQSALLRRLSQEHVNVLYHVSSQPEPVILGVTHVDLNMEKSFAVMEFVEVDDIDFTIVFSEKVLATGLVDLLIESKTLVIGPTQAAAKLITSEVYASNLMRAFRVPQANFLVCEDFEGAELGKKAHGLPLVIKVDGIVPGRKTYICRTEEDWQNATKEIYLDKRKSEKSIILEELLEGEEISVLLICDGEDYKIIGSAQSQGTISPSPLAESMMFNIKDSILDKIMAAMFQRDTPYEGFLHIKLMVTSGTLGIKRPKVIGLSANISDPAISNIFAAYDSSLFNLLQLSALGDLNGRKIALSKKFLKQKNS